MAFTTTSGSIPHYGVTNQYPHDPASTMLCSLINMAHGFRYFFNTCRRVLSKPHSKQADGNRSWRFRVVNITVQVLGDSSLLEAIQEALEGATSVLHGMEFGEFKFVELPSSNCSSLSSTTSS